jgi:hypothetical protein
MSNSRRNFIKKSALTTAGIYLGANAFSAKSYRRIIGANDRVRVGVIGFSDRHRSSHAPSFMNHYKDLNFDLVAVSDIWSVRREQGVAFWKAKMNHDIVACRNNEEMYDKKLADAVFISTCDFQHATHCIQAVKAGCDAYCEKPFAETMEDNRNALKAVKESDRIVQIGSQRRSGANYQSAADFIQSGKFGPIKMVELTWNVNQPGRWRRPALVAQLKEEDTDWKRWLINRPEEAHFADEMNMQPNLLPEMSLTQAEKVVASANTGGDALTDNHVRNWMECIRSRKQPHAPVEAGYSHSIANIMTTAASHTGLRATFDEATQEVMVGGKPFKY